MAKTQTFGDKAKKQKVTTVNVKVVKAIKSGTNHKFQEKFVRLDDISKVADIK
jgi:hypothetical protein